MKKLVLKIIAISLFTMIFLTGCGKGREIKDLSIVDAIGIDIDEDDRINLTFQFYNAPVGDAKKEGQIEIYEASGETVQDAILNAETLGNKQIYLAHNNIIIVGKETAEKGFNKFIDAFERNRDIRENVLVVIAEGKASEIMKSQTGKEGDDENKSLKNMILSYKENTRTYKITLLDICEYLTNKDRDFLVPIIRKNIQKDKSMIKAEGIALFNKDKMVGEMKDVESFALVFLRSNGMEGTVVLEEPLGKKGKISLNFIKSKSKINMNKEKNEVEIKVSCDGQIWECNTEIKFTDIKTIDALEKGFEDKMREVLEKAVNDSLFVYNSDVLGIKDENFSKNTKFKYDVKVNIVGYGLVSNTVTE